MSMKKIFLYITLFIFFNNTVNALETSFCFTMAEMGESVIVAKESGVPLSTLLGIATDSINDNNLDSNSADLMYKIVTIGYDTTLNASEYKELVFEICKES